MDHFQKRPMQKSRISHPGVQKVSRLIDALIDHVSRGAEATSAECQTDTRNAPCLASWDAFTWFELAQDWELADFLTSGTDEAKRLVRSLQSWLRWCGQTETEALSGETTGNQHEKSDRGG